MPLGHLQGGEQAEGMEMGEQPEARLVEVPRPLAPAPQIRALHTHSQVFDPDSQVVDTDSRWP